MMKCLLPVDSRLDLLLSIPMLILSSLLDSSFAEQTVDLSWGHC